MGDTKTSKRGELIRNTVVFQLKLMADGFRDLILLPVSLIATIIGLLRGGDQPDREFQQVIQVGRDSEQWINLFGNHEAPENSNAAASIDALFIKVEETLKQQYLAAGTSKRAQAEIDEALQAAHQETRQQQSGE
ncbi:MAG: hypothetical protein WBN06_03880 [Lysobacterales bacterium]